MSRSVPTLAHAGASGRVVPASIEISPSLGEAMDRAAPMMIGGVYRSERDRGSLSPDEREASTPHLVAASPRPLTTLERAEAQPRWRGTGPPPRRSTRTPSRTG